jgi:hypothetical protein
MGSVNNRHVNSGYQALMGQNGSGLNAQKGFTHKFSLEANKSIVGVPKVLQMCLKSLALSVHSSSSLNQDASSASTFSTPRTCTADNHTFLASAYNQICLAIPLISDDRVDPCLVIAAIAIVLSQKKRTCMLLKVLQVAYRAYCIASNSRTLI